MTHCPKCKSPSIHRSRSRSTWERWRKEITGKRTFRCQACGWRGWGVDDAPTFSEMERAAAERAIAPEPPNLAATPLARQDVQHLEVDFAALDSFVEAPEVPDETPAS
jgi:hypothetical protein